MGTSELTCDSEYAVSMQWVKIRLVLVGLAEIIYLNVQVFYFNETFHLNFLN